MEAEIERVLGRRPSGGPFGSVTIRERGHRLRAELRLDGAAPRVIDAALCDALVHAAALVIALHVDPDALSLGLEDEEPETPAPANEPTIVELDGSGASSGSELAPASGDAIALGSPWLDHGSDRHRSAFLVGAGLVLDVGALPGLAPGVWIGVGARFGRVEVGVEGRFMPDQRAHLAPRPQVGADVSMLAGSVRLGYALGVFEDGSIDVEIAPSLALELGSVSANGVGLMTPLAGTSLWLAAWAGVEARVFVAGAFGLFARTALELAFRRSAFVVRGYTTPVFEASEAGFMTTFGAIVRAE